MKCLKIEWDRTAVQNNKRKDLKCEVCRKYKQECGKYSLSAYWNPSPGRLPILAKLPKLPSYLCWRTKCTSVNEGRRA
jgi:hypothetical protein